MCLSFFLLRRCVCSEWKAESIWSLWEGLELLKFACQSAYLFLKLSSVAMAISGELGKGVVFREKTVEDKALFHPHDGPSQYWTSFCCYLKQESTHSWDDNMLNVTSYLGLSSENSLRYQTRRGLSQEFLNWRCWAEGRGIAICRGVKLRQAANFRGATG